MVAKITPLVRAELPPDELDSLLEAQQETRFNPADYPKPEVSDIEALWEALRPHFDAYHLVVQEHRQVRFLKDELPPKLARRMKGTRRFRSRLSHNEVLRVAAMMTRNAPKVVIPSGNANKGQKQSRWANALLRELDRRKSNLSAGLYRTHADALCDAGMAAFEVFMIEDSAYDRAAEAASPQMITDEKTGEDRMETADEAKQRSDEEMKSAGLPFGVRNIDPLTLYFDEDDDGCCPVLIVEMKPYKPVFNAVKAKNPDAALPKPGTPGWPQLMRNVTAEDSNAWYLPSMAGDSNATDSVLTIRYYDKRWTAYVVGGRFVEPPTEHGMPGLPVIITGGMVTSSPNLSERFQGVIWGMKDIELAVNDLMTVDLDVRAATARPKPVVVTPANGDRASTMNGDKPATLDLSSDLAPYLKPGQTIIDAFEHLRPRSSTDLVGQMLSFWQRSGLNPIAQGESPGSDPAGYTVNSLTQAAQSQYEVILDNFAITLGHLVDFCRLLVRDTIRDKVSLAGIMNGPGGDIKWETLAPSDVDEAHALVIIDPLSDANRIAQRQSLSQGNKDGYVSRRRVQTEGYGVDSPEQEDDQIAIESAANALLSMALEEAKAQVYANQAAQNPQPPGPGQPPPPQPSGLVDQNGNPISSDQGQTPAPPQPPTVGAAGAQGAGPPSMQPMTALAGQGGTGMTMTGGGP